MKGLQKLTQQAFTNYYDLQGIIKCASIQGDDENNETMKIISLSKHCSKHIL